jgi:hypothetical protein
MPISKAAVKGILHVEDDAQVNVAMIRTVLDSRANLAVIPLQDLLGPGQRGTHEYAGND